MLPLLELSTWRRDPARFAHELRLAAHGVGFFMLRHDRHELCTAALREARRFFALPSAEKEYIDYRKSSAFRGYMACGLENTGGKVDMRGQIELAVEGPVAERNAMPVYRRLAGPNQWPRAQPELRGALMEFAGHMEGVGRELTSALCMAMRLPPHSLEPLFREPHWQMKAVHYLPVDAAASVDSSFGVGAHTDSGFLTLLVQDSGGLQVFTHGEWVDVPPVGPDVIVCNLGEVAQMASSGYFLSTPHRVGRKERISLPFFFNPSLDATVTPLPLPLDLPWDLAEHRVAAEWRSSQNSHLHQYGMNAFKSLARSHPELLAAHHPDISLRADGSVVLHAATLAHT